MGGDLVQRRLIVLAVSDIHGEFDGLARVAASGEIILILGDLLNLTDYRTGDGLNASLLGLEFARQVGAARSAGDYAEMRRLFNVRVDDDREGFVTRQNELIERDYRLAARALDGVDGYAIHGNVDRPSLMRSILPTRIIWADGGKYEIEGLTVGFVGGGTPTPMKAESEVPEETTRAKLESLGQVDVLCSHLPPTVDVLRTDVVTGLAERASGALTEYLMRYQPRFHLFGDVHQPQATCWRVGRTTCFNLGYFRATRRAFRVNSKGVLPVPVAR